MNAAETSQLVTNMFPGSLRDKILLDQQQRRGSNTGGGGTLSILSASSKIQQSLAISNSNHGGDDGDHQQKIDDSNPLAELYPGMWSFKGTSLIFISFESKSLTRLYICIKNFRMHTRLFQCRWIHGMVVRATAIAGFDSVGAHLPVF